MSVTLAASLAAHQKQNQRRPVLTVTSYNQSAQVDLLRWTRFYTGAEADSPNAAALAQDGSLLRARNQAGTLYVSRVATPGAGSTYSSWTNLNAATAGTGVALAARTGEALLAYVDGAGLNLQLKTSADNGATWSAATLIVTEASAIGSVALAFTAAGDACLFYTLGTTTTLKRLRRTAGVWAGAGTNWSKSASVASLTGLAAAYDGSDFALLITGTEVTTTHKRTWAARMGDVGLPLNAWSGLKNVAESDSLSTVTYAGPAIANANNQLHGFFATRESGNVAFDRAFYARPAHSAGASGNWNEPAPHECQGASGPALAMSATAAWLCNPSGVWHTDIGQATVLTTRVLACSWQHTPTSSRCQLELDNHDGGLSPLTADLSPGSSVVLQPGYASGTDGAAEYGIIETFTIEEVTHRLAAGQRTVMLDCHGPWEDLARWRAPQAWQTAAGALTRDVIFARIAAKAGIGYTTGSSPHAPSSDWSSYSPAFGIAAGENGASVLARLMEVVTDFLRPSYGSLEVIGPTTGDTSAATFSRTAATDRLTEISLEEQQLERAWVRVQGPDRYAEVLSPQSSVLGTPGDRSELRVVRNLDATTNAKATAWAANAARRDVVLRPAGELVASFSAALQLYDVVTVQLPEMELASQAYRIIAIGMKFARSSKTARYDTTITLGGL